MNYDPETALAGAGLENWRRLAAPAPAARNSGETTKTGRATPRHPKIKATHGMNKTIPHWWPRKFDPSPVAVVGFLPGVALLSLSFFCWYSTEDPAYISGHVLHQHSLAGGDQGDEWYVFFRFRCLPGSSLYARWWPLL